MCILSTARGTAVAGTHISTTIYLVEPLKQKATASAAR